jgi:hypothetical protein
MTVRFLDLADGADTPEPAGAWLMLGGIAAAGAARRAVASRRSAAG